MTRTVVRDRNMAVPERQGRHIAAAEADVGKPGFAREIGQQEHVRVRWGLGGRRPEANPRQ
jgi:hypothetical protein